MQRDEWLAEASSCRGVIVRVRENFCARIFQCKAELLQRTGQLSRGVFAFDPSSPVR